MSTTATKTANPIVELSHRFLGDLVVNRFMGIAAISVDGLIGPNGQVLSESELKKKGVVFASITVNRNLADSMKAKHSITEEVCPFRTTGRGSNKTQPTMVAIEKYKIRVVLNGIWQNAVDNKVAKTDGKKTEWKAGDERSNGILNYRDSRVICHKIKDGHETFYINYIVFDYLTKKVVVDAEGKEYDMEWLDGFMKQSREQKTTSRKVEADKHGLEVKFDPQIRQLKMKNVKFMTMFGNDYVPKESTMVIADAVVPQPS